MTKKVFKTLITIVACVAVGVFILNIFMPNIVTQVCSAIEGQIYNATSISIDINGDGKNGKSNKSGNYNAEKKNSSDKASKGQGVEGFDN